MSFTNIVFFKLINGQSSSSKSTETKTKAITTPKKLPTPKSPEKVKVVNGFPIPNFNSDNDYNSQSSFSPVIVEPEEFESSDNITPKEKYIESLKKQIDKLKDELREKRGTGNNHELKLTILNLQKQLREAKNEQNEQKEQFLNAVEKTKQDLRAHFSEELLNYDKTRPKIKDQTNYIQSLQRQLSEKDKQIAIVNKNKEKELNANRLLYESKLKAMEKDYETLRREDNEEIMKQINLERKAIEDKERRLTKRLQETQKRQDEFREILNQNKLIKQDYETLNRKQAQLEQFWQNRERELQEKLHYQAIRFHQQFQAERNEMENQYRAREIQLENSYRKRMMDLQTQYQAERMALAVDLQKQYQNGLYDKEIAQNKINVHVNHPEIGYRTEYPERWNEETMKMKQQQQYERDRAAIINKNKLARLNLEEEDATETLRKQLNINDQLNKSKSPEQMNLTLRDFTNIARSISKRTGREAFYTYSKGARSVEFFLWSNGRDLPLPEKTVHIVSDGYYYVYPEALYKRMFG